MSLEKRAKWTGEEWPGKSPRQELGRPTGSQEEKEGGSGDAMGLLLQDHGSGSPVRSYRGPGGDAGVSRELLRWAGSDDQGPTQRGRETVQM